MRKSYYLYLVLLILGCSRESEFAKNLNDCTEELLKESKGNIQSYKMEGDKLELNIILDQEVKYGSHKIELFVKFLGLDLLKLIELQDVSLINLNIQLYNEIDRHDFYIDQFQLDSLSKMMSDNKMQLSIERFLLFNATPNNLELMESALPFAWGVYNDAKSIPNQVRKDDLSILTIFSKYANDCDRPDNDRKYEKILMVVDLACEETYLEMGYDSFDSTIIKGVFEFCPPLADR